MDLITLVAENVSDQLTDIGIVFGDDDDVITALLCAQIDPPCNCDKLGGKALQDLGHRIGAPTLLRANPRDSLLPTRVEAAAFGIAQLRLEAMIDLPETSQLVG